MIGGLPTLLRLLESPRPGLRARAAEVLATCAQANPPVQARPVAPAQCAVVSAQGSSKPAQTPAPPRMQSKGALLSSLCHLGRSRDVMGVHPAAVECQEQSCVGCPETAELLCSCLI